MTFDFNFTDEQTHRVALYMVDFDKQGRSQTIELVDPATGASITGQFGQRVGCFTIGRSMAYELRGHVQLRLSRQSGPIAVINGIFIVPAVSTEHTFVRSDPTTGGTWRLAYGSEAAFVAGSAPAFPGFVNA